MYYEMNMIQYTKEKTKTLLHFYKFIVLISGIITVLLTIVSPPDNIALVISVYFSTFSFLGSVLLNHYLNRKLYTFYRNQGFSIKIMYIICFFINLFISIILFNLVGLIWQI